MDDAPNLKPDAFVGTAEAYARHRPPYPPALLDALVATVARGSPSALLDLACGPGRIALDLAAAFDRVVAVDLEPEMVTVGTREAARRGIDNVVWSIAAAEQFQASAAAFDLVTIGEAFHRLDQRLVAIAALRWLRPGGCLATLGAAGILAAEGPWQAAAADVAHRWMARAFPDGWAEARSGAATGPEAYEQLLRAAGFVDVVSDAFTAPQAWTIESIVGYFESTSVCSRRALGKHFAGFEDELRATLLPLAEGGVFHEAARFGFTLARKPLF
jgi:ubiquinone/menaquinone biosynthesis C-methylase UbiE